MHVPPVFVTQIEGLWSLLKHSHNKKADEIHISNRLFTQSVRLRSQLVGARSTDISKMVPNKPTTVGVTQLRFPLAGLTIKD